jgi:carbon monoxide dehydrogenase subunit G
MSTFQSKVIINKPVSDVYRFLSDFNNHQQLMPDEVQNWSSTYDEASFDVQNKLKLSLKIESRIEDSRIKIIPTVKPPFDVELNWTLSPNSTGTDITFTITADLNMMMKMMASGPLKKLADSQTQALVKALTA